MKKHSLFIPEYVTENIYTITPFLLAARGYRGVVFDLDNTVAPYEHLQPDKATQDYFAALAEAGVQTALVSNNRRERIELFNERLGVFIVADAQKPSPRGVHRGVRAAAGAGAVRRRPDFHRLPRRAPRRCGLLPRQAHQVEGDVLLPAQAGVREAVPLDLPAQKDQVEGVQLTMAAKFGPGGNSESFYAEGFKSTLQAPGWVRARGLDAYEYQGGNGITASPKTLAAIGQKAAAHGVAMSLHAPYYISLSSEFEEKRVKSLDYIAACADAGEALGARIMVVHTGSAAKISRETAMAYAADTVEKACALLTDKGTSVRMGLETMGKQNQLGTLDEVLRLCAIAPAILAPVVDFGHLNAREGGVLRTADDYKRIFDAISSALGGEAAETLHCHFSQIEYTKMGEKRHLTFADETFGPFFGPLAEAIVSLGVSPTIICESAGTMAEDALRMKELLYAAEQRAGRA